MNAIGTRIRRGALALALFCAMTAPPALADENDTDNRDNARPELPRSDAVFLLDVSGSMRKKRALARAQELLTELLDKVVQPGTQVAFIPFGTGVHTVRRFDIPEDGDGAWAMVQEMRTAIDDEHPRDTYTYLFQAVDKGLEVLHEFQKINPGHSRHIILVSDGKQLTRRGEPRLSLQSVLERWNDMEFRGPEDWYIWYAYIGAPDRTLERALEESGAGQAIPLDKLSSVNWSYTRFDKSALELGRQMPGTWTTTATLVAETDAAGVGRKILLKVPGDSLPEGMTITFSPSEIELTGVRTEVEVEVTCEGAVSGDYDPPSLLLNAEKGSLHWIEPRQMRLHFDVASPQVTVATDRADLGRAAPGRTLQGTLVLTPDADAAEARPMVTVTVADTEQGVSVEFDESVIDAGERREVAFRVTVPEDAVDGSYECTLRLEPSVGTELDRTEITVGYRVGFGTVSVDVEKLVFERVLTGRSAEAEITLTPDAETAALGRKIGVIVGGGLPEAVDVEVASEIAVDGSVTLPLRVRVPAGVVGGTYRARLLLAAPADIRLEPTVIPITLTVVEAATLMLPPVVDLGDVAASKARAVGGRFDLAVAEHQAGADLEFVAEDGETAIEPGVVTLKQGANDIGVKLFTVDTEPGARTSRFKVYLSQDGERNLVGTVAFQWRVTETFLKVTSWVVQNAVPAGDGEATCVLLLEASPDLAGRSLRLAAVFDGLAGGMAVTLKGEEVALTGGLQKIPVLLTLKGARVGKYGGKLQIGLGERVEGLAAPEPLDLRLEVAGATVYLAREGGLDGLQAGSERILTLVLTASAVPAPVVVEFELERGGLPAELVVDLPENVVIDRADGVTRVPVRVKVGSESPYGSWQPRILVKAQKEGVAISPASVAITAEVPDPITVIKERTVYQEKNTSDTATALWAGIAAGVVILVGLAAFLLGRRKTEIVHVQVPMEQQQQQPAAAAPSDDDRYAGLLDDDLVIEEDDMLVLEGLGDDDEEV